MKHSLAAQMQITLAPVVKKRVAAYARVSTEHEEQQTSYDAQVDYYTKKIKERTEWVFVEVYTEMLSTARVARSASRARVRGSLRRMDMCRNGRRAVVVGYTLAQRRMGRGSAACVRRFRVRSSAR